MDAIRNSMCKNVKTCFRKYPIPICILFSFFLSYMFFPSIFTFLIYSSPLVGLSFLVHRVFLGIDRRKIKQIKQIEQDDFDRQKNKQIEQDDITRRKIIKQIEETDIKHRKIKQIEEDIDRPQIKQIKQIVDDDRKKRFAKSRRSFKSRASFKSSYDDCSQLVRRNAKEKSEYFSDSNIEDENYAVFSKSFHDLLVDKNALIQEKPKEIREVSVESVVGGGERSSSNDSRSLRPEIYSNDKDELEGISMEISEDDDDEPRDKAVRWTEDDQKNVMDLGLLETERNKRLESLMEKRRSRKNLGFQEKVATTGNHNNGHISAIKIAKMNPFLEDHSRGMNTPGSAPSSLLSTRNPFDLPYDPHEEKPDLSGDNFHEELTVVHQKEQPIFCRHQSFSLGAAFSHPLPEMAHDKHEISFYKDFAPNHKNFMRVGNYRKGVSSSERLMDALHPEDETERNAKELEEQSDDSYDERKADIFFFYGGDKKVCHAPSNSIVSDLQVEVSDEGSCPCPDDLDLEKDHINPLLDIKMDEQYAGQENNPGISSNSLYATDKTAISTPEMVGSVPDQETQDKQCVLEQIHHSEPSSSTNHEMENKPQSLNSDIVESSNHLHESSGGNRRSLNEGAPDGLTTEMVAPVGSSSPISVLQPMFSTDQASPYYFANEGQQQQQSDNRNQMNN